VRAPLIAVAAVAALALAAFAGAERIGRALLSAGQPALAAPLLADPAWKAVALYEAGEPDAAAATFRTAGGASAAYNLGNALARSGRWKEAVTAYDVALARDPDDADARTNRAIVAAAIAAAEAGPGDQSLSDANAKATRENRGADSTAADDDTPTSSFGEGMAGDKEAGGASKSPGTSRVDRRGAARPGESESGQANSKGAATDSAGRSGRSGGMTSAAATDETAPPGAERPPLDESAQATLQWLAAIPDDPVKFLRLRIAAEHQHRLQSGTAVPPGADPW
jgi:Ca-activated chloride channel family protein